MVETFFMFVSGALFILGGLAVLVSAIGMLRVRDAVSRVNSLGPATAVGVPMIILGALIYEYFQDGVGWMDYVKVVLSVNSALVVSSVASNTLGRAAYRSGARLDPKTHPNELAGR